MLAKKIDPNCRLMVDEMAIRKAKVYSQPKHKFVGHVDLGAGDVEDTRLATNAMVFMAVGLKGVWRHPVAYFLTDHLSGETQAELARTVLCALSSSGLKVRAFVADGLQANMTMFRHLGVDYLQQAQLQLPIRSNFFLHPATGEKVHVLLDVVHMLKLLRNLFGEQKRLQLDGEQISWKYIQVSTHALCQFLNDVLSSRACRHFSTFLWKVTRVIFWCLWTTITTNPKNFSKECFFLNVYIII